MIAEINNPINFSSAVSHFSIRPDSEAFLNSASYIINPYMTHSFSIKRKVDFIAGRYCVQKAFEQLGITDSQEIGIALDRSPIWPSGWIGSITHTYGFASAAIAKSSAMRGLGIDSERILTADVARDIAGQTLVPTEIIYWERELQSYISFEQYLTLLFSAKESFFKCLNPITGIFLEFHAVTICFVDLATREFHLKPVYDVSSFLSAGDTVIGKFSISQHLIHTAVELPNDETGSSISSC